MHACEVRLLAYFRSRIALNGFASICLQYEIIFLAGSTVAHLCHTGDIEAAKKGLLAV